MNMEHRDKVDKINSWRYPFKLDYGYIEFYDKYSEEVINQIYDLVIDNNIDLTITNPDYIRYLGYYYYLKDDLDEMKRYFQINIDNGDSQSMVDLALYYLYIDENLEKAKEFFEKSVEKNNLNGMFCLAICYAREQFGGETDFNDKESDRLFEILINNKHHLAMEYLGNFYLERDPVKSREYFEMIINSGNPNGNFGIIRLGCSQAREIELLTEILVKWEVNRCIKNKMSEMFGTLAKYNVDPKLLLEHCNRLGLKNDDLRFKIQAQESVLINKKKLSKHGECAICMEEKELIPFDCFGHFFCVECEIKTTKCSVCRISRNQLIYME